jgi:hypothetical protein
MGRLIVVCLAAVVTLAVSPASAQDVESLRREVEALRKHLQSSPGHLVQLIRRMRDEKIKAVLVSAWNDRRTLSSSSRMARAR